MANAVKNNVPNESLETIPATFFLYFAIEGFTITALTPPPSDPLFVQNVRL